MRISDEVREAQAVAGAIVALESTILAHGLPPGRNRKVATRLEKTVRAAGAVPATIAVLDGEPHIGLTGDELDRVCGTELVKLSRRDLAPAYALGRDGATTVAATAAIAAAGGIRVFATGGLGGVHRGAAGHLRRVGGPRRARRDPDRGGLLRREVDPRHRRHPGGAGDQVDPRPRLPDRDVPGLLPARVGVPGAVDGADPGRGGRGRPAHFGSVPGDAGIVLANPVPPEAEMPRALHDELLAGGLALLAERGITGHDVTPALLEHFHAASGGVSIDTNEELVVANAALWPPRSRSRSRPVPA